MKDSPLVTVICSTYNQCKYISRTLESLLSQDTNFKFEILVHDDCSTDGTRDIVLDYHKKNPEIIRLITQSENKFSQGYKPSYFTFRNFDSKYIALCEGDDFWISTNKLQMQFDLLERNRKVDMCFSDFVYLQSGRQTSKNYPYDDEIVLGNDIIKLGGGGLSTATLMFRGDFIKKLPDWYYTCAPVGDLYLQFLASFNKSVAYLAKETAIYRVNSLGSWSSQECKKELSVYLDDLDKHVKCFEHIENSYSHCIDSVNRVREVLSQVIYSAIVRLIKAKRFSDSNLITSRYSKYLYLPSSNITSYLKYNLISYPRILYFLLKVR